MVTGGIYDISTRHTYWEAAHLDSMSNRNMKS